MASWTKDLYHRLQISMLRQEFQAPATPTEQILAGLWGGMLRRDRVGRNDNFFRTRGTFTARDAGDSQKQSDILHGSASPCVVRGPDNRQVLGLRRRHPPRSGSPLRYRLFRLRAIGPLPLSHAQQRLWFMQQLDPTNPLYHFAVAVRITGPFDANLSSKQA